MIKYSQLMVDIESLGTNPDCPVISIGAAWFDIKTKTIGPTFKMVCSLEDQIDTRTRFVDSATLKWWLQQNNAARQIFKDGAKPTKEVLETFRHWIMTTAGAGTKSQTAKKCFPWGNSNSFDLVILESIFKDYGVITPWNYYSQRDLRTFKEFVAKGAKVEKLLGTNHDCLDDAINQINYIFKYT